MKYQELLRSSGLKNREAELLLLDVIQKDRVWFHININKTATDFEIEKFNQYVFLRKSGKPIEYILHHVSFYGEIFYSCEDVLIARPETEILIDKTLEIIGKSAYLKNLKILEVGVGSGIISIMLYKLLLNKFNKEDIQITAIDISEKALLCTKKNLELHKIDNKNIKLIQSDMFQNIDNFDFNIIVSNPPYIANNIKLAKELSFEPDKALFSGSDGLDMIKKLILESYLQKVQYLLIEMGYDQKLLVTEFIKKSDIKIKSLEFYKDLAGLDRGFIMEFQLR